MMYQRQQAMEWMTVDAQTGELHTMFDPAMGLPTALDSNRVREGTGTLLIGISKRNTVALGSNWDAKWSMGTSKVSAAMRDLPSEVPSNVVVTPALVSYAQGGMVYAMHNVTGAALWKRNFSNPIAVAWSIQPGSLRLQQEFDLVEDLLVFCGQPIRNDRYQCRGLVVRDRNRHLLQLMEVSETKL